MLSYVIPGETAKEKYAKATKSDATLQLVTGLVEVGWPNHKRDCPVPAKPFWSERSNLSTAGGLLLRGHQVVVPVSLQSEILRQFHDDHFVESKCLERAKSCLSLLSRAASSKSTSAVLSSGSSGTPISACGDGFLPLTWQRLLVSR